VLGSLGGTRDVAADASGDVERGTHVSDVTPQTVLRVNPKLVVWPGAELVCGFADGSGTLVSPFHIPAPALRVLRAFSPAKPVSQAFHLASDRTLHILRQALDRGLIVDASRAHAVDRGDLLFEGFHIADLPFPADQNAVSAHVSRHIRVGGRDVLVIDGLLAAAQRATHRWLGQLPYFLHDVDSVESRRHRHWISVMSPSADYCDAVPVIRYLASVGQQCFCSANLEVSRAHAYCVPYGEVHVAHRDFDEGAGITLLYFANTVWREEWGADMLFFGESGEPEIAVAPKPGRIVVFHGDIRHRAAAPARFCTEARYTLVVRLVERTGAPS
jgi:SM-20-related protein